LGLSVSDRGPSRRGEAPPEDFFEIRRPGLLVWMRKGFSFLVDEGGALREDRGFCPARGVSSYSGRGRIDRLSLGPMGDGCALIRHYRRGGVFGGLLRDFYIGRRRFLQEVRVSEWARSQDIPTAEVLALRIEHKRLGFCHGDLVTREIGGSEDLDKYLQSSGKREGKASDRGREIIRSVALLLQRMHRAGLYHADLNLKNILIQVDETGVNSYVIDLDRARVIKPLGSRMRIRNLVRLYRSLDKQGYLKDLIGTKEIIAFVRAYCGEDRELLALCKEVMRKDMWMLRYHRAGWKLSRGLKRIGSGRDDG